MPKRIFRKISPSPEFVRNHKSLAFIAHLFEDPNLFHLNRHCVSRAFAIGLGVAMTPIYGHMPLAALLAIWCRANLPISVILVWVSNPLTFPFMLVAEYWVGAQLLGIEEKIAIQDLNFQNWLNLIAEIWQPLLLGSVVLSLISALLGFYSIKYFWHWEVVRKWKQSRAKFTKAREPVNRS